MRKKGLASVTQERCPSDIAAVAHTALSLENYAQIYACIHQMKNKKIQLADAQTSPFMTRKNLSEVSHPQY
jgi:hypothetical protein